MAGEGQLLRGTREAKNWSLAQAEEVTKIRVRYLEAMEEENYSVLPGATYVKGFLRTYAKQLGLNPEDIMELYKSTEPVNSSVQPTLAAPFVSQRKRPLWFRPVVAVVAGLVALGAVVGIASLSKPQTQKPAAYTPPALPTTPKVEPQKQAGETNPPAAAQPQTPQQNPSSVVAATTDGLKVQLVFTQPTWLTVNSDGKPVLEGTFNPGTTKELTASDKIELATVGNAGGVSITLNGLNVPSLGASGQVVHNIVFTKDTLTQLGQAQNQSKTNP